MRRFLLIFVIAICLSSPVSSYGLWITSFETLDGTTEQGLLKVMVSELEYDDAGNVIKITGTAQGQHVILIPELIHEDDNLCIEYQHNPYPTLKVDEEFDLWIERDLNFSNPQIERLSVKKIGDKMEVVNGFMVKNICGEKVVSYIGFALQSNPNLKPTSYDFMLKTGWIP